MSRSIDFLCLYFTNKSYCKVSDLNQNEKVSVSYFISMHNFFLTLFFMITLKVLFLMPSVINLKIFVYKRICICGINFAHVLGVNIKY